MVIKYSKKEENIAENIAENTVENTGIKYIYNKFFTYITLFSVIFISFWFYYGVGANTSKFVNKQFFFILVLGVILILVWMKQYTMNNFIRLIIAGGIFMRIFYMLQTYYTVRSHDLGTVTLDGAGHASYIYTIFMTGKLPEYNVWQFYHPPLFHWLAAKVLEVFQYLYPTDEIQFLFQCTKIVSCFASCATLLIIKQICDELKMSQKVKIIVLSLMAFYPNYYLLAGRVNNDSLVIMFIMMIVLFTIRWYYNQTIWNIIGIALGFGLGMMTKMNASTMAILVGPLFLYVFYKKVKERKYMPYIKQYVVFALISFPIGLWYPIRNYYLFKQPLQYVMPIGPESFLSRVDYSWTERFLPTFKNVFDPIYTQVATDYSLPLYLVKSSMFGEFSFQDVDFAAKLLLKINVILILLSIVAMIYILINKKEKNKFLKWGMFSFWALLVVTYISFNVSYPSSCTMDYRYIVPTSFVGSVFIGLAFERFWKGNSIIARAVAWGIVGLVGCFSLSSIYIYCIVR